MFVTMLAPLVSILKRPSRKACRTSQKNSRKRVPTSTRRCEVSPPGILEIEMAALLHFYCRPGDCIKPIVTGWRRHRVFYDVCAPSPHTWQTAPCVRHPKPLFCCLGIALLVLIQADCIKPAVVASPHNRVLSNDSRGSGCRRALPQFDG